MTSHKTFPSQTIDVSGLPASEHDTQSPLWWGNTLNLFMETTVFGGLIAIYVTVAMNTDPFPPIRADRLPVIRQTEPDLFLPVIGLIVLLVSLIPAIWLDISARRHKVRSMKIASFATLAFNIAAIVIRYYEFDSLYFKWNDNAYGSITWMILIMHMIHLFVLFGEDISVILWIFIRGADEKQALDLTIAAVYWYWIVGIWVLLLFPLIYIVPRLI
jgi:cytochrome c oxidase subunit III